MLTVQDSPFYRVTAKALIFDDARRLLLTRNGEGFWEVPGGGWEHDESFADGLAREIQEELGVGVTSVGDVLFMYRGVNRRHGFRSLRIVVPVELSSHDLVVGDGMVEARFFDREEFLTLDMTRAEGDIHDFVDRIWPIVAH